MTEGNKVASGLSNQLGMSIGTEFTVEGISGVYKLTNDGITQYGYLISQQQLLYILHSGAKLEKI